MDAPGVSRRSFLAAIAAALALKPEHLVRPPLPHLADAIAGMPTRNNPVVEGWADSWLQEWSIWDTVIVQPGRETREALFAGPSPTNFAIRSIGWSTPAEIPFAELREILEGIECRLVIGGLTYFAAPVGVMAANSLSVAARQPIAPQIMIAPQSDFRLEVAGDALSLAAERALVFYLQGVLFVS